ncbi:MAG: hypothetical protein J7J46_02100 [Candidatus Desulfofervidus sp.]|nr:hypothetical protein [Candidatus Desulfofervidus sp.]
MSYTDGNKSDILIQSALRKLVPDVRVDSVEVRTSRRRRLYFQVFPNHREYWSRFRDRYHRFIFLARERYGALTSSEGLMCFCPEFESLKKLVNWLSDVLDLPQGERNLLHLLVKWEYKC